MVESGKGVIITRIVPQQLPSLVTHVLLMNWKTRYSTSLCYPRRPILLGRKAIGQTEHIINWKKMRNEMHLLVEKKGTAINLDARLYMYFYFLDT